MQLDTVTIPRVGARQAAADYRREAKRMPEGSRERNEYEEIARAYALAANEDTPLIALTSTIKAGGTTIRTLVSGSREHRTNYLLPNLAVCRASAAFCHTLGVQRDGAIEYVDSLGRRFDYRSGRVKLGKGTFRLPDDGFEAGRSLVGNWSTQAWRSMVPLVPPKHRPARTTLDRYLVLWEADDWMWASVPLPPRDPALLKHLAGDLYAVLATWDLSELERLVLTGRREE